jgi:hypothetical protein
MSIFAIGVLCPITQQGELFPRNCVLENILMGKENKKEAFPELKCAYLEIKLDPKNKKASYKCCHPKVVMCQEDKHKFSAKEVK